jgi:type III secretion protein J
MRRYATLVALLAAACSDEVLLHRLDEAQANQVMLALGDAGVEARKAKDEGEETAFAVTVRSTDAAQARRILSARDLPRTRIPAFTEVLGTSGLVPTPLEEHARYLHALSGELARTLEALDGVTGARVHLALPIADPLRPDARRSPRASVLLRCRPDARERVESLSDGIRRVVSGAAEDLDPGSVSVLVAEAHPAPGPTSAGSARTRTWLAGSALALSIVLGAGAFAAWRRGGGDR